MNETARALLRAVRVSLAMAGTTFLSTLFKNPMLIWLTPILSAIAKYLRDKHPKTWDWLPF